MQGPAACMHAMLLLMPYCYLHAWLWAALPSMPLGILYALSFRHHHTHTCHDEGATVMVVVVGSRTPAPAVRSWCLHPMPWTRRTWQFC